MNLTDICQAVVDALSPIIDTVDLYTPRTANPPQAWVEATDYLPGTFGDTAGTVPIKISVAVSRSDHDEAWGLVYGLISDDTIGSALRYSGLQTSEPRYTQIGDQYQIGELTMRGFQIVFEAYV